MSNKSSGYDQNSFNLALNAEGVDGQLANLARSIFMQESGGGKNTKTSNANAHGGMQIIPATFKSVADSGWDISDPEHNMRAGIRYLKQLDKQSGGQPALTAAGYYGGPGGLEKARQGIAVSDPRNPNAPNTLQYGQSVVRRMQGGLGMKSPDGQRSQGQPQVQPQAREPLLQYQPQQQATPAQPYAGAWGNFNPPGVVNTESMGMYGVGAADVLPQSYRLNQAEREQYVGAEDGIGFRSRRFG